MCARLKVSVDSIYVEYRNSSNLSEMFYAKNSKLKWMCVCDCVCMFYGALQNSYRYWRKKTSK